MTRRFFKLLVLVLTSLLAAQIASRADPTDTALAKVTVLEGNVVYLRIGQIGKNLEDEIRAAQGSLAVSNKIAGTVLDLRFAGGDDLDSAKAAEDLFTSNKMPLAILVNGQTRGAAAALAADLREKRTGLIFGGVSAPLQPDIVVATSAEDERSLMDNPYAAAPDDTNSPAATNNLLPIVDHTSEADLVRAKIKDGDEPEPVPMGRTSEPPKHFIRDPVLARAADLIKGLAIVRAPHS